MIRTLLIFCLDFFKSQSRLQLENIYLRKQLVILKRTNKKFQIRNRNRFFFVIMKTIFNRWRESLIIIKPETVIKWHRKGFKLYWRWKCRNSGGRPKIPQEQITLIKKMAKDPFNKKVFDDR